MCKIEVLRAEYEWQRAGAYSVRIQGMNRQHHISLKEEFDKHDCDGTKYIVLLDDGYPVATCRFYETDPETVTLGRVVVREFYKGNCFYFFFALLSAHHTVNIFQDVFDELCSVIGFQNRNVHLNLLLLNAHYFQKIFRSSKIILS